MGFQHSRSETETRHNFFLSLSRPYLAWLFSSRSSQIQESLPENEVGYSGDLSTANLRRLLTTIFNVMVSANINL